jgi:CBS domain-containing protein
MSRVDVHLDAMLRQLGAAYYESLRGQPETTALRRAASKVARELGDSETGYASATGHPADRVQDAMITTVITASPATPASEVARLLVTHNVSGLPIVQGGKVVGIITEGDLINSTDEPINSADEPASVPRQRTRQHHLAEHLAELLASDVMTAPAVTISADAPLSAAARTMRLHQLRRLPVTDGKGALTGIISRHDLLRTAVLAGTRVPR